MLKRNSIFIALSLILVVVLGLALVYIPKGELHILLCNHHTPARDIFFRYYTHVGEWFPYVFCVALLLFGRVGDGLFASACMIGTALTTQIIKHIVNAPRPLTWFNEHMPDTNLPLVDGVRMNEWFSFPSGHTTSFFALAFVACILLTSHPSSHRYPRITGVFVQILLFFLAALGAYSRIYLSQHFALDVLAGIIIGVSITILTYIVFLRFNNQKWYNYRLFQKK